jgi:formate dehydrogenase (NADP+) beta subunit
MANTDITKPIDLTIHGDGTGPKRARRPVYMDFMPPCNSACPAGENIQAWMDYAQAGNYYGAFQKLMEDNPFPAIMGRVCVRSCETGCNRNHIDNTVNIHAVERFIGDNAIVRRWQPRYHADPTGKRILVVGSGPSGLSAAYHLKRMGHSVEIYEADWHVGGLMRYGIPSYRLPRRILDAEINRVLGMGIKVRVNYRVTNILHEKEAGNFDAVYMSIGADVIREEPIIHENPIPIRDAFTFLKDINTSSVHPGQKIIIYGGGKLAMYLARIIKRLGAEAIILFPGDRKLMPAYDYEADDAIEEGVNIQFLRRIHKISHNAFTLEKMKVEKGKAVGTGEWEITEADELIMALNQEVNSSFLQGIPGFKINDDGTVAINAERMTGHDGIFAGGDMLPGEQRSVTIAIGHGKKAARYIDAYLSGKPYAKPPKHPTASIRRLVMWYKTEAPLKEQDKLSPGIAVQSFEEIISGLNEKEARYESQRCLSCGNCFECDGCYGACPEGAIIKLGTGNRYKFDYNKCTGCSVCFEQCPCHAIDMIPEPLNGNANGG